MKDQNRIFRLAAAVIVGIGLISIIIVCLVKYLPTAKRMDAADYFGSLGESEAAVILDYVAPERAVIVEGNMYIDYTLVQSKLNSRFYWDSSEGLLLFTTAEQLFEISPNSTAYTVDGESFDAGYEILKTTSSGMYLSVNFMQQYTNLRCETFENPSRVVVTFGSTEVTTATLKKDGVVRYLGGIKSPILTVAAEGTEVMVLDQMEKWSKIRTPDGYIGYIRNSSLKDIQQTVTETWYQGAEYTSIHLDEKVNLVWHQITNQDANALLLDDISAVTGVNVISPTWYSLSDNAGGVTSWADADYVRQAHEAGLQVWALISNFSDEVSTTAVLASRSSRQAVQYYLIDQAKEFGFDGINIDLEAIAQEASADYIQFMREMSILCRKNGIILSVDVPVPTEYSVHYGREELGVVCDYVIVMGYDEHYAGSELTGSVASMNFEITGIQNMLLEVPAEKLVSGIPFYARLWYTQTQGDGSLSVTSEAVTMNGAQQILEENGAAASYDESTGQQYAEWTASDGTLCQIWLEDENSVAARAALVREYGLAGIAAWSLGQEADYVWEIISSKIQ